MFTAPPGQNVLGPSNTLQVGDNLTDTGTNGTLNYTAVASLLGNPALAAGVTMNGIANANILNTSAGVAGFSGNITGLTPRICRRAATETSCSAGVGWA